MGFNVPSTTRSHLRTNDTTQNSSVSLPNTSQRITSERLAHSCVGYNTFHRKLQPTKRSEEEEEEEEEEVAEKGEVGEDVLS